MDLESWLDGYDQKKDDLLAWCGEGGAAGAGARSLFVDLEKVLKQIRHKVQADVAAADLARLGDILGRPPAPASPASASRAACASASPESAPVPAPPPPSGAAEGILKSLNWMDAHAKAPAGEPSGRGKTTARPAVLDMFGSSATAVDVAPTAPVSPPAPSPDAVTKVAPAAPRSSLASILDSVLPEESAPPEPAVPDPQSAEVGRAGEGDAISSVLDSVFVERPAPTTRDPLEDLAPPALPAAGIGAPMLAPQALPVAPPVAEPEPELDLTPPPRPAIPAEPVPVSAAARFEARATPVAPTAPARRKRKPILVDCPQGDPRRAALEGVGPGPNPPFLMHAVVEIPRGGGTAYIYNDPRDEFIVVDHPGAKKFPALNHVAYGFIPDSVSDDGAHLDAFVVSTGATGPGDMMRVRALGYLRRADGDHKLFCVPEKHSAKAMVDVPKTILQACETWKNSTGVTGGTWCDGSKARDLIRRCLDM